ncbi:hypothetical protein ACP70R_015012 [Stipagrostis hirtigluma subsp. patula]
MEGTSVKTTAVAPGPVVVPDDAVVEIFKLLPAKSLHRFKCVSKAWRGLVTDPLHRAGYAQTLAGFFLPAGVDDVTAAEGRGSLGAACESCREGGGDSSTRRLCRHSINSKRRTARRFVNVSGMAEPLIDAAFPFLPPGVGEEGHRDVILDSRDGLILLGRFRAHDTPLLHPPLRYLVCNPTTEQFASLPGSGWTPGIRGEMVRTYLLFDHTAAAAASPFHLIQFWVDDMDTVRAVHTYSSAARAWTHRAAEWLAGGWLDWGRGMAPIQPDTGSAVVHGMLHLVVDTDGTAGPNNLVAVDETGRTRRTIPLPRRDVAEKDWYSVFLARSQGRLHHIMCVRPGHGRLSKASPLKLLIWVLEDYDAGQWVLNHTVSFPELFGRIACQFRAEYNVVAVHPDGNWVFLVRHWDRKLVAYDMDRREVLDVCDFGSECGDELPTPYVPLYKESSALQNKN